MTDETQPEDKTESTIHTVYALPVSVAHEMAELNSEVLYLKGFAVGLFLCFCIVCSYAILQD
jgi:hypothetical protein